MAQGSRPNRIGEQLRGELGDLLAREVKDPGIGFTTLTRVRVSPDLSLARVYYTTLGSEAERRETVKALRRAGPFLRRQLGRRLRLRRLPELVFSYDEALERQECVERILLDLQIETGDDTEPTPDE